MNVVKWRRIQDKIWSGGGGSKLQNNLYRRTLILKERERDELFLARKTEL